jgi:hypothetical protein
MKKKLSFTLVLMALTHILNAQSVGNNIKVDDFIKNENINISQASHDKIAEENSSSIEDFEITKIVKTETTPLETETVKDIAVAIQKEKVDLPITISPLPSTQTEPAVAPIVNSPTIDLSAIKKLLSEHSSQFKNCYQAELDSALNPETIKGTLTIKFKINKSGKVSDTNITTSDVKSVTVLTCVKNVVVGIKFPESDKSVSVNQPINLRLIEVKNN